MIDRKTLDRFGKPDFRHAYIDGRVRTSIAMQIRALREKLGWTQQELARRLGKKQAAISRLENLSYGKVTVNTLLEISRALDMALVVRIVSFDEFLIQHASATPRALDADTFEETVRRCEATEHQVAASQLLDESLGSFQPKGATNYQTLVANVGQTPTPVSSLIDSWPPRQGQSRVAA